jgi:penicillin-binding protein 1A
MSAYSARIRRRRANRAGPARLIIIVVVLLLLAVGGGIAGAVGYVLSVAHGVKLSDLKPRTAGAVSVVYAADGHTRLGFISRNDVLRTVITTSQMPADIRDATVAIEDQRFYKHKGVDYEGVLRAAVANVLNHKDVQGGSTLTMQLIRNIYTHNRTRTFQRKIKEAVLAQQLEKEHPGPKGKQFILTQYLNNVPYGTTLEGQSAIGIQAAARVYFDRSARALTLPEAAMIAGLPQAPTAYDPLRHPAAALARRNVVLQKMAQQNMITQQQALSAEATHLGLHPNAYYEKFREGYILAYVKQELIHHYGAKLVDKGGLRVYTSINLKWQRLARKDIATGLNAPDDPAGALVSMNPHDGQIEAMASSVPYGSAAGESTFDLASQSHRQAGSTMKVITLMAAIRDGADPKTVEYDSTPLHFTDPGCGCLINVHTDDNSYTGPTTLFQGLVASDNTVYQQLDLDVGPKNVTKTAHEMGITSKLFSYPSEGLGAVGVSPLEMTDAYSTVASGGVHHPPTAITKVVFPSGHVDKTIGHPTGDRIFTDGMTDQAIQAMHANITRGTGTHADTGCASDAGKTGTTSNFTDAWFNGFVPGQVTAVWIGYPKTTRSMISVPPYGEEFGGDTPADIWHQFMEQTEKCKPWPPIKTPFVARSFSGRYVLNGGTGGLCSVDPGGCVSTTTTPATVPTTPKRDTGTGKGTGGAGFPPSISAPQTTTPAATPTPTPTPTPTTPSGGTPLPPGTTG